MRGATLAFALLLVPASPMLAQSRPADPLDFLTRALRDPTRARDTLAVLRTAQDKDLAPLFLATASSGDKDLRLLAVGALGDFADDAAVAVLAERLRADPSMIVRTEALMTLTKLKRLTREHLAEAVRAPDDNLQLIAARTAILQGHADLAREPLERLANSADALTASMARVSLLGLGQSDQLAELRKTFQDARTDPDTVTVLADQIGEEKVTAAAELLQAVAASDRPWQIRLRAYKALALVSPKGPDVLLEAIRASEQTSLRVHLTAVLSTRKDADAALAALARDDDAAGALARFERARPAGGDQASRAVEAAMKLGHPVVIDYVLGRANQDVEERRDTADFYTRHLLGLIRSVQADPRTVLPEHVRAARAATLLGDLGTPAALEGLKEILQGRHSAAVRVAATGLLRSKNRAVCDLVRPLLKSPYDELVTDAALTLGRFGDAGAAEALRDIAAHEDRHPPALVALAQWYLLKISGQSPAAAKSLAGEVK